MIFVRIVNTAAAVDAAFVIIMIIEPRRLTHWGRDKMADILQTTFLINFIAWKILYFDWNSTDICFQNYN